MKVEKVGAFYFSVLTVASLMILILAITPAKAAVPGLTYYANDGSAFVRSGTPFDFQTTDYIFSQTILPAGGIRTTLTPKTTGTTYADLGFGYTFGRLGDISSITIDGNGSYSVNVYFDTNTTNDADGNGPFFSWSGGTFSGMDGDTYGLGPTLTDVDTITPSDSVYLMLNGNTYTIAQLQSGTVPGIDSNTLVGFWFGVINHPTTAQFEIYMINGEPVASPTIPVGGETISITFTGQNPISTLQLAGPWIILALAIAAATIGARHHLLRKPL